MASGLVNRREPRIVPVDEAVIEDEVVDELDDDDITEDLDDLDDTVEEIDVSPISSSSRLRLVRQYAPQVAGVVLAGVVLRMLWRRLRRGPRVVPAAGAKTIEVIDEAGDAVPATFFDNPDHAVAIIKSNEGAIERRELPEKLIDMTLSMPCATLFKALFDNGSVTHARWFTARGDASALQPTAWRFSDGAPMRKLTYNVATGNFVTPVAHATEMQRVVSASSSEFIVHVIASTPNVPFGKSFHTELEFHGTAVRGGTGCHLVVAADVVFTGGVGLLRGQIMGSTVSGLRKTYAALQRVLEGGDNTLRLDDGKYGTEQIMTSDDAIDARVSRMQSRATHAVVNHGMRSTAASQSTLLYANMFIGVVIILLIYEFLLRDFLISLRQPHFSIPA